MRNTNLFLRPWLACLTLAAAVAPGRTALGYERGTHGLLTSRAYANFLRDNPTKLDALGILRFLPDAPPASGIFGETYYDLASNPNPRTHWPFEDLIITNLQTNPLSVEGWLMRGVIREDDVLWGNPQDDPSGNMLRVLNHFYDPFRDRPLSAPGALKATDWATGAVNAFTQPNHPQTGRRNHYTIFDVQEALFRALTLKTRNSFGMYEDLALSPDAQVRQATRQAYWATAFRGLGDVLHLNQDMAQPQHTRNDPHAGLPGAGHASIYEGYIEGRALGLPMLIFTGSFFNRTIAAVILPVPLNLCVGSPCVDYPLQPLFQQYSDFWSTTPGSSGGIGIADYSNRGFFSAGKNLGHNEYPLPPNDHFSYEITSEVATGWGGQPIPNAPPVWVYRYPVADSANAGQTVPRVPLTSYSVFDDFMLSRNNDPAYHLIRENYDAQADLLLPRAVSYSAALLQYVFRGSMEITPPDEGVYAVVDHSTFHDTVAATGRKGFGTIRLKLKNTSPPPPSASGPEAMSGGSLFGVLRFHRNTCYHDDLTGQPGADSVDAFACRSGIEDIVVSDPITSASVTSAEQEFTFRFTNGELPINATDVVLQAVYRGPLGNESDAVVVASKNLSEPSFATIHNAFDYLGVGDAVYTRAEVNASSTLLNQVDPQACVDRTQNPPRLRSDCFSAAASTLSISLGSGSPTTVRLTALPARRFVRVAILGDATDELTATLVTSLPVADQFSWTLEPLVWEYDFEPPNTILEHIADVTPTRGIYGWNDLVEFWDAGFHPTTPPEDFLRRLSALTSAESQPFPVDISPQP